MKFAFHTSERCAYEANHVAETSYPCRMIGRYVTVLPRNKTDHLTICEAVVYGKYHPQDSKVALPPRCVIRSQTAANLTTNLALKKNAKQSSVFSGDNKKYLGPWLAVNGAMNRDATKGFCAKTNSEDSLTYWFVDLGKEVCIYNIRLIGRTGYPEHLRNFDLWVTNSNPEAISFELHPNERCAYEPDTVADKIYPCRLVGRYVTIVPRVHGYLTICDVLVFGSFTEFQPSPPCESGSDPLPNVALNKPAKQPTVYNGQDSTSKSTASKAVDGSKSRDASGGHCSSTAGTESVSYWFVDLQKLVCVKYITMIGRGNVQYKHQLQGFDLWVTRRSPEEIKFIFQPDERCAYEANQVANTTYWCTLIGRYVAVVRRQRQVLTM